MEITQDLGKIDPVQYDRNRAEVMEFLYWMDGRDDPEHPHAHTYTGLADAFRYVAGELLLEELTTFWHDHEKRDLRFDVTEPAES
mgnify:CR=1 FL=1